jgi:hypothetical protein
MESEVFEIEPARISAANTFTSANANLLFCCDQIEIVEG